LPQDIAEQGHGFLQLLRWHGCSTEIDAPQTAEIVVLGFGMTCQTHEHGGHEHRRGDTLVRNGGKNRFLVKIPQDNVPCPFDVVLAEWPTGRVRERCHVEHDVRSRGRDVFIEKIIAQSRQVIADGLHDALGTSGGPRGVGNAF
jgi:hypothetical protein